jgi:hypothetical protein
MRVNCTTTLGLLDLRIFEATGTSIIGLAKNMAAGWCACAASTKVVFVPLPPAVVRAIDRDRRSHQRADPAQ